MAREINKFSALEVKNFTKPGVYADGGNLYLQVGRTGSKSWLCRFMQDGRAREMGLGAYPATSLSEARNRAFECRKLLEQGKDPIAERDRASEAERLRAAHSLTFQECALKYIEAHRAGWRNPKHASQWGNTLRDYAFPTIGNLPVAKVDTECVLKCLEPIWTSKNETATRVRGRIEAILDWAATRDYRSGENPARWRGHLQHNLASPGKIAPVQHFAALPYPDLPQFMAALRSRDGSAARALEFAILTASRTNEVLKATWPEISFTEAVWVIPSDRMKASKEHRVPLSDKALAILHTMQPHRENDYIFPGQRAGNPLSDMALLMTLRRMKRPDLTAHGFRSTFRDWAAETTAYPRDVAEMALAHTIGDKVEAAYRRGDLFNKRKEMMQNWADFCAQEDNINTPK